MLTANYLCRTLKAFLIDDYSCQKKNYNFLEFFLATEGKSRVQANEREIHQIITQIVIPHTP